MPAKSQWLIRLPEILEELSALSMPVLDRALCERLFRLRRRRTIELLHRFGGYQAGRTFLIDRLELIRQLRDLRDSPEVLVELRRRQRLSDSLEKLRKYRVAESVQIRVVAQPPAFPEGMRLTPGELTIRFKRAEELLGKLYEIAQAAAGDFERFRATVEGTNAGA